MAQRKNQLSLFAVAAAPAARSPLAEERARDARLGVIRTAAEPLPAEVGPEVAPPADAESEVVPPAAGPLPADAPPTRPALEGARTPPALEPLPADAEPEVAPPSAEPLEVVPPADARSEVAPPADARSEVTSPADPRSEVTSPADARSEVTSPADAEPAVVPPADPEPAVVPPAAEPLPADAPLTPPALQEARTPPPPEPPPQAMALFPGPGERSGSDLHVSRRLSDLVRRLQLMEREAKSGLGITLPQAHALLALDWSGSLRMQELAATLGLAQSTVTRLVAPLKRMKLLDRRPDSQDGRATRAFLTAAGRKRVDELEQVDRALYGAVFDRIPATRRAEVVAAVELLHEVVLAASQREE